MPDERTYTKRGDVLRYDVTLAMGIDSEMTGAQLRALRDEADGMRISAETLREVADATLRSRQALEEGDSDFAAYHQRGASRAIERTPLALYCDETNLTLRKDGEPLSYAVTLTLDDDGMGADGWQDLEDAAEMLRNACEVLRAYAEARRRGVWHRLHGEIQDALRWEGVAKELRGDLPAAWRD